MDLTRMLALALAVEWIALSVFTMRRGTAAPKWLSLTAGVLLAVAAVVSL